MSQGKGSLRRPSDVPPGTFAANYERTFGEPASRMPERFPPPTIQADDLMVLGEPDPDDLIDMLVDEIKNGSAWDPPGPPDAES